MLAAVFILAFLGYPFAGDYDWIAVVWMVVITSFTVGYGETSQLPPRIQALAALVTLLGFSASVSTFACLFQLIVEGELENVLGERRMKKGNFATSRPYHPLWIWPDGKETRRGIAVARGRDRCH